jgi:RNA polymerase sigma-70 factor (ECF subfamily)
VNPVPSASHPDVLDTARIFRECGPYAWRALRRLGVAESDVEDACQEVFVVVHRRLPEFEHRSSITTWVYGICVRTASDYRKRMARRREVVTSEPPEQVTAHDPHHDLAVRQAREQLDQVLGTLDDDKRSVFVLYEIEQLSMNDVAQAVGCPVQTAYSRLHAARALVTASVKRLNEEMRAP